MNVRVGVRHWLIRSGGMAGALICGYLLSEPLFSPESIFCAPLYWLGCGATEILLGMHWLKPFNALIGLGAFVYFTYGGFRLPRLGPEAVGFRRLLLILANVGLGYALFFRALEVVMASQLCLPCALMFGCVVMIALGAWGEWAHNRTGREKAFVAGHFYGNMIKLSVVFVLVSFGGTIILCSIGLLPQLAEETKKNLNWVGFDPDSSEVIRSSLRENINHLLFIYEGHCLQSYRQSLTFLQPEVQELLQAFPKTLADIEPDPNRLMLEQYQLAGTPSLLVLNPRFEVVHRLVGEQSAEALIAALAQLSVTADDALTTGSGR